ncbi:MAG: efflux RND transporter periplasmic adaptor subunit, partial [Acidobacteria bacterium]|nr:efflux RND transporter periplasmic adaptor subunit [Acidobacteriota bacterium]
MNANIRKAFKHKYLTLAGLLTLGVAIFSFFSFGSGQNVAAEYLTAKIERASITNSVTATGTLQALRTVQVGSQISGQIQALYADFNSVVKKGQLLARIDPRTFETQVTTEQAQLTSALARVQSSEAELLNQRANLVSAEANAEAARVASRNASTALGRAKQLAEEGLIAASEYDVSKANADSTTARVTQAEAAVEQAQAAIRSREAQLNQVKAEITGARAGLERASLNLELTNIYSPVDGVVISRNVDIGQTVAASLSAPTLFMIANDLTEMQVKASVDEADIGKVSAGASVHFTVD